MPPKMGAVAVLVPKTALEEGGAPKAPDAGFGASPPLCCAEVAAPPNENGGVPAAGVEPKTGPPAGATDVFALGCSPDELGVMKLKDMAGARRGKWVVGRCCARSMGARGWLGS